MVAAQQYIRICLSLLVTLLVNSAKGDEVISQSDDGDIQNIFGEIEANLRKFKNEIDSLNALQPPSQGEVNALVEDPLKPNDDDMDKRNPPPAGFQGVRGKKGAPPMGFQGVRGKKGAPPMGFQGVRGKKGAPPMGFQGVRGKKGAPPMGFQGVRGKKGAPPMGFQGVRGKKGAPPMGFQGVRGKKGAPPMGFQGVRGKKSDGVNWEPSQEMGMAEVVDTVGIPGRS